MIIKLSQDTTLQYVKMEPGDSIITNGYRLHVTKTLDLERADKGSIRVNATRAKPEARRITMLEMQDFSGRCRTFQEARRDDSKTFNINRRFMKTIAGAPAYPQERFQHMDDGSTHEITGGLTKREYFAALAMQGYLSSCEQAEDFAQGWEKFIAKQCVVLADALIEGLNEEKI